MRTLLALLVFAFGSISLRANAQKPISIGSHPRNSSFVSVNPISLLANPEKYDGKKIRTDLYLKIFLDPNSTENPPLLFALKEDMLENRSTNAFSMYLANGLAAPEGWGDKLNQKRVWIVGVFRVGTNKVLFLGGGGCAITEIEYVGEVGK